MFDQLRAQGNNSIAPLLLSNYQKQQLFLGVMTSGGGNVDGGQYHMTWTICQVVSLSICDKVIALRELHSYTL